MIKRIYYLPVWMYVLHGVGEHKSAKEIDRTYDISYAVVINYLQTLCEKGLIKQDTIKDKRIKTYSIHPKGKYVLDAVRVLVGYIGIEKKQGGLQQ